MQMLIIDVPIHFTLFNRKLNAHGACLEYHAVVLQIMPIPVAKAIELLEPSVDCFLSSAAIRFCHPISFIQIITGHPALVGHAAVRAVCLYHFIVVEFVDKLVFKYLFVRPLTTWEWPIYPNDVACLKTHSNLISHTRTIVFVTMPLWVK